MSPDDPTDGDDVAAQATGIEHIVGEEESEPRIDADQAQVELNTAQWDDE